MYSFQVYNKSDSDYIYVAAAAESLQSCLTLSDPVDGSPPGSSVHWIVQARVREWVAIAFSDYIYTYIYILFQILFLYRLLQNIAYSSLCHTVGPFWLFILFIVVYLY